MRSIILLLILVMIGLNGKGQSVTALPDSVLSQCCLEVTLLNGNVTTVDWVFIQYITRDGTGTKLFVEYAPNFGGIQWETQIRIQDDFDDVLERSRFIMLPFTVGSTDYAINRNWIANIEENTTTGGTWVYGRFGSPTKRKFSAVEDYETLKNLLLACRPRAIAVAENGLYTEGDTVRMGGFLIEPTTITTEGYNWQMKDTLSSAEFGLDYDSPWSGDTVVYWARRAGKFRQITEMGRRYWANVIEDTTGVTGIENKIIMGFYAASDDPYIDIVSRSGLGANAKINWFINSYSGGIWIYKDGASNPYYTHGFSTSQFGAVMGSSESGTGDPGNGVSVSVNGYGVGADEWIGIRTKNVDNGIATAGQFLSLVDVVTGKVEFATLDLSPYLEIADTNAMLEPYIQGSGTINYLPKFTAARVIGNSNIQDNNTAVSILNSKPFALGQWTTAGRPTGVTGYEGYNATGNGKEWYNGTRWAYALESTFARGTATRIPVIDANGQIAEDANFRFRYNASSPFLEIRGANMLMVDVNGDSFVGTGANSVSIGVLRSTNQITSATNLNLRGSSSVQTQTSAGDPITVFRSTFLNTIRGALAIDPASPSLSPVRTLHVNGEARIIDLTTDTPTRIVGADADGDLGAITVGTGLSLSGGTLTATGSADGNGIYTGSGTLSQHTTRALIPSTGNLFFSQKFNANADSAYFNIVNYLGGERAVNFGLTDTSSTGYSRGFFESDGAGNMNWTLETNDANGSTTVRALEGVLSLSTTAGNISLSAPVDQDVIMTGLVRAKQEGYYEINSTSSPQNLSNTYSDNYINQGGTQATFTLVFPASPEDGQILKITYNNAISSLTLDGNGNTIVGTTVTTAVAGTQRIFKFYAGDSVWIRQN